MNRTWRLVVALSLNAALVAGQVVFGIAAHSLGLLADAVHNIADVFAVGAALVGWRLSYRLPTRAHSYGWHRATVLAALANAASIVAVAAFVLVEAVSRLGHPVPVRGGLMTVVALVATAVNVGAALALHERQPDLNMRSALLHMAGDAEASLGVALAGAVILATGRFEWLDPAVSIAIAVVISVEAWRLARSAVGVLMEATPPDIDPEEVRAAMSEVDGVSGVHDLHLWSLSSGARVLSAHLAVGGAPSLADAQAVGAAVKDLIAQRFRVAHATLELETADAAECVPDTRRHAAG